MALAVVDVETIDVSRLKPYPNNPRRKSAVEKVAKSIEEFGFRQPIVVDREMVVIAGHTRLAAAKSLGLAQVPIHIAEGLTEAQVRAYRIADNRAAQDAEWDWSLLVEELTDLEADDYDLRQTGFDVAELNKLLKVGEDTEDLAPPVPDEAVTKPGDLYTLGQHRLLCGDATNDGDVSRLLGDVAPNLMVTDPPYGVDYDPTWRKRIMLIRNQGKMGKVTNDDRADWREAWSLFPGNVAYVWHDGSRAAIVDNSLNAAGFEIRAQIIWAKDRLALGRGHYHWQHEPCFYSVRKNNKASWEGGRKQSTLWRIAAREDSGHGHGTQKPVECMRRPIENNSSPGQAIYDPFVGSGTTLIAAESTGRSCYAMELDPAYCDVAIKRWEDYCGQRAKRDGATQN